MPRFAVIPLSGSTNGRMVLVAATATPGTTFHTGVTGTTDIDEIWGLAVNSDTTNRKLTIEYGGTTAPNDLIEFTVPAEDGLYLLIPGLVLRNALVAAAFAAAANLVMMAGKVYRRTA